MFFPPRICRVPPGGTWPPALLQTETMGHRRPVGFVAVQTGVVDANQPPNLLGDRREHFLRRHPSRHHRCNSPQRSLLGSRRARIFVAHRRLSVIKADGGPDTRRDGRDIGRISGDGTRMRIRLASVSQPHRRVNSSGRREIGQSGQSPNQVGSALIMRSSCHASRCRSRLRRSARGDERVWPALPAPSGPQRCLLWRIRMYACEQC
jgi:hypothetical protein